MSQKSIVSYCSIKRRNDYAREQKKKASTYQPTKANVENYQKRL